MKLLNKEIGIFKYFFTRGIIFLFNCLPNHLLFDNYRQFFLKLSGINIKGKVKVFSPISISPKTNTRNIFLKENVFINSGARFSAPLDTKIILEKNSLVGPNVCFETVNHGLVYKKGKPRGAVLGDIHIKEGVWIGLNSIILQNVVIEKGCVVAAGSLVNKSFENYSVVGGIPAKIIKTLYE